MRLSDIEAAAPYVAQRQAVPFIPFTCEPTRLPLCAYYSVNTSEAVLGGVHTFCRCPAPGATLSSILTTLVFESLRKGLSRTAQHLIRNSSAETRQ